MRILVVHNHYQQRGGEDVVFENEVSLLRNNGHEVATFERHNSEISRLGALSVAARALWSAEACASLATQIASFKPQVMHVHNTLPLISPAIYRVAHRAGVAVVQTLHNYRASCLNGQLLRNGAVCEDCIGRMPWRGIVHACYRQSRVESAVLAMSLTFHRAVGTYARQVDRYLVLNNFCRDIAIRGGLPASRLRIKANFANLSQPAEQVRSDFLFVGRLSEEKGIGVLGEALRQCPELILRVAGSGPAAPVLERLPNVRLLGSLSAEEVSAEMRSAIALITPSVWYEVFPMVIVEAFANALPVIATNHGALAEIIEDNRNGLLFPLGSAEDSAGKMRHLHSEPSAARRLGMRARADYESSLTPEINLTALLASYSDAIDAFGRCAAPA